MKHTYRIFECGPSGEEHYFGKTVEVPQPDRNGGYLAFPEKEITYPLLTSVYGFTNVGFVNYYHIDPVSNKDKIIIAYHYPHGEGIKPTWVLKRGR